MNQHVFCTFRVGKLFLGIPVEDVQEVMRPQAFTNVPHAPDVVVGLINLRGEIMTAIDLSKRLGLQTKRTPQCLMSVVIRSDNQPISLLVDDIGEVITADDSQFELPPSTLQTMQRDLLRGAYKLPNSLLLVLDTTKLLQVPA